MSQIKLLLAIIADVRHLGDSLEAYAEALTASDKLNPDDFEQIYPPVGRKNMTRNSESFRNWNRNEPISLTELKLCKT